ncbi:MAG: hypothetical protein HQK68_11320 [Desulfamplus sp.]|nr:hypothetical protein [Desulfamplus sp.]
MKVVGRILNDKEVLSVKFPFSKNTGKKWTLETMKSYINKGIEEFEKDPSKKEPIENGLKIAIK